jgi:hypothetical protein
MVWRMSRTNSIILFMGRCSEKIGGSELLAHAFDAKQRGSRLGEE